ncbi:putative response regulator receiver modulated serine phosphatase [Megalodesulfovibrio gigas DSM 1382 = ATCC 19364]|uniref:Putative response regulator receiver modulated serine phosphatase n=1 Tax=Megalodesulfovibrio gigas (strain ATCC 19364 / DSM 1382 / NCIMB 9332 / VKM B-1759) TaxID=1121448 RepID=T2GDR7_MEGG1|nr:putative response regulator receiver modulated serine phosphatase [Megalodesulfovibrio gigas DSM 1382 = ATCC 19364]
MSREPLVLVVDDEPLNVLVLQGLLKAEGFLVIAANNGETARELAVARQPDVILLDIMMPEESGFQTCGLLKLHPATLDIPIIFVSALTDVENKVKGLELGAVDYIGKPFEKAEVLARVRLHVKLARARKALVAEQAAKLQELADAQRAMLVRPEDVPQARFAVCYLPALEAGGDFYDVLPVKEGTCCYFVADICGHDLGSSFVTSSLKALLHQNSGPLFSPEETLKTMNSVLATVLFGGRFLTAQSLHVDRLRNRAVLVNAGHPAPVHLPRGGAPVLLEAQGDILGVFASVFLEPLQCAVAPGDRFLLYTDGLLERFRPPRRTLAAGQAALLESLARHAAAPLEECAWAVARDLGVPQHAAEDDTVLLLVEV